MPTVITHPTRTPETCIGHDGPHARSWTRPRDTTSGPGVPELRIAVSVPGSASSVSMQLAHEAHWSVLTVPARNDV
ncbi:MAG: hypothetical protein V4529_11685 [Gemmatimonadota bacterium]